MTILIVHYHLRAGGVTRVIQTQANILRNLGHQVIIASSGPIDNWDFPTIVLPALDYQKSGSVPVAPLFGAEADLWIIHNPTLGLNAGYPDLIKTAAESGIPLLLQIHDFVEDGRPANYQLVKDDRHLYPSAPQIHYATINRRDLGILKQAGLPPERCHHLPNAVDPPVIRPTRPEKNLVFYPIRGIRRKNLGELCLLAAHAPKDTTFAVALRSSSEEPAFIHDDWVRFASAQKLLISFDVVGRHPERFPEWLERSSHLVTTSISEGFGLTFLDPAFLNKPLIGRDLPEITSDFTPYGTLYRNIPIPVSTLPGLRDLYGVGLEATMSAYGKNLTTGEIEQAWQELTKSGSVDFGNLPESLQRHVIETTPLPWLADWLAKALAQPVEPIDTSPWSVATYREAMIRVISSIGTRGPVTWIPPERILSHFLTPRNFHFLRAPIPADYSSSSTRSR